MKWNDKLSRLKMYALESFRIMSVLSSLTVALLVKKDYNIPNETFVIILLVVGMVIIVMGYVLVKFFKEGEQKKLFDKTPQFVEMLRLLKTLERRTRK